MSDKYSIMIGGRPPKYSPHPLPVVDDYITIDCSYISNKMLDGHSCQAFAPCFIGPIKDYEGMVAKNLYTYEQHIKVYSAFGHCDDNKPSTIWHEWKRRGFINPAPKQYGAHDYSWNGYKMNYREAINHITAIYKAHIGPTTLFKSLAQIFKNNNILLVDTAISDVKLYNKTELYEFNQTYALASMLIE